MIAGDVHLRRQWDRTLVPSDFDGSGWKTCQNITRNYYQNLVAYLKAQATKIHSRVLGALAMRVEADPFKKVKKMIKDFCFSSSSLSSSSSSHPDHHYLHAYAISADPWKKPAAPLLHQLRARDFRTTLGWLGWLGSARDHG